MKKEKELEKKKKIKVVSDLALLMASSVSL